jgi:hypothetical protein
MPQGDQEWQTKPSLQLKFAAEVFGPELCMFGLGLTFLAQSSAL